MNKLSFCFKVSELNGWPKVKFFVDQNIVKDHCFSTSVESVDIFIDYTSGAHVLKIERYDKTDNNLLFDSTTLQIIKDQTVELKSISVDDVELPISFLYRGIWKWNNKQEHGSLYWGPNGTWTWSFETPVIDWVIRENRKHQDGHIDLLTPYKHDLSMCYKYLDQLETAIHEVSKKNSTG